MIATLPHQCCSDCHPPEGGMILGEDIVVDVPNSGYSAGLQYRYVHGSYRGTWRVWDRHTGTVAWSWFGAYPILAERDAARVADALNGIRPLSPAEQAALNAEMDDLP